MGDSPAESVVGVNPVEWGDECEGLRRPFDPANGCCQAPCPPGALGNTKCCKKKTEYWVQRWTCFWHTERDLPCGKGCGRPCEDQARGCRDEQPVRPGCDNRVPCAFTKKWRCNFYQVPRCEVLKRFACRPPARCPTPGDCYHGESECFVPEDTYFARVWEIDYECCSNQVIPNEDCCIQQDSCLNPAGCACCGLYEVCHPRWVKITCKANLPPEFPYEQPLPYYERPAAREACGRAPALCAGSRCAVGPNANRSPDFWLSPVLPYA